MISRIDEYGNTSLLYNSSAELEINSNGGSYFNTNNPLGLSVANNLTSKYGYYAWKEKNLSFDLGVLNPNQSVTIKFDLVTTAHGDFGTTFPSCAGYGYSYGIYCYGGTYNEDNFVKYGGPASSSPNDLAGYGGYGNSDLGKIVVTFSDPTSVSSTPAQFSSISVISSVPEPSTFAMFGIGLGALTILRRKRKSK